MNYLILRAIALSGLLLVLSACGNQPEMASETTAMKCGGDKPMKPGAKCASSQTKCQASGKCGK